ncbi:flagellar hook-associated protein FlgK [Virgibacillus necropolis]|uniref:Flagellar hook-associated protein 1 n=1 Tax=Virgibacillus necropolis TaxID=163877 RepID=A0A221MAP8_9BACI|nr:flagellar hook-associated protein FlgK [Virgibacillus necropolis]ASN04725.1 flagellar hook-associated protein FlgK [Virgibacillus necropolis]
MSTFHGLEMAKQALFAQQSALYTTGHNISNANTEGYTRQRVNFATQSPFPTASRNRPEIPGQMGTGVEAGSVQRVRDQFLDYQFRAENSKAGFWTSKTDSIARMESLMNEPSENGLSKTMDQFWQSLQDLSVNPKNAGARSVVAQRGLAVAETFNYLSSSLSSMRTDLKSQIDVTVKDANSILSQVNEINKQIQAIEPHGYLANDLYDERDRLIDELSGIVTIKVTYTKSGENSPAIADGLATIELVDDKGKGIGVTLVDGESGEINEFAVDYSEDNKFAVTSIRVGDEKIQTGNFNSNGSLYGFMESYGYEDANGSIKGTYTNMLASLDKMAIEFAGKFNEVHENGQDLKGNQGGVFFVGVVQETGAAASLTVSDAIMEDPDLIAASEDGDLGNGNNASALADVFDEPLDGLGENTSVKTFYESLIGELGVHAQEANRMAGNTIILKSQVENQRMSVSSVSLDEEMSNMIKYQHAYNAAARSLTAVDELLERIINNMGIVGR